MSKPPLPPSSICLKWLDREELSRLSFKAYVEIKSKHHLGLQTQKAKAELLQQIAILYPCSAPIFPFSHLLPQALHAPEQEQIEIILEEVPGPQINNFVSVFNNMDLTPIKPTPVSHPSSSSKSQGSRGNKSSTCSTCSETPPGKARESLVSNNNNQNSIFCCATNKVLCMGLGVDEGKKRHLIERFIKDLSWDEERFVVRRGDREEENVRDAWERCKFVIEVQRSPPTNSTTHSNSCTTTNSQTSARYFIPSRLSRHKYIEVHPRDIFPSNPLYLRGKHAFMYVRCWEARHAKWWVARRVSVLEKPSSRGVGEKQKPKLGLGSEEDGNGMERENEGKRDDFKKTREMEKGKWFVNGLDEKWGEVWKEDDE